MPDTNDKIDMTTGVALGGAPFQSDALNGASAEAAREMQPFLEAVIHNSETSLLARSEAVMKRVSYFRGVIFERLKDCSTVDYHDLSDDAVDNLALIAASAVVAALERTP